MQLHGTVSRCHLTSLYSLVIIFFLIVQFYSKLEEKRKALEDEKLEAEARKKVGLL